VEKNLLEKKERGRKVVRKDVKSFAKSIFGEAIVNKAYLEIRNEMNQEETRINNETIEPSDGNIVLVELVNGKKFKIWASEWGGVTTV